MIRPQSDDSTSHAQVLRGRRNITSGKHRNSSDNSVITGIMVITGFTVITGIMIITGFTVITGKIFNHGISVSTFSTPPAPRLCLESFKYLTVNIVRLIHVCGFELRPLNRLWTA